MALTTLVPWVSTMNSLVDRIVCLMCATHLHARAFLVDLGEVFVGGHKGPYVRPQYCAKIDV